MKKYLWIVVIVVVVLIIAGVVSQKPTETGPIKLGFIGVLSGDGAPYGETEKNALEIARKEINDAGGIAGRLVEIVYEDGKCTGKDAISAIQKLLSVDKINIILGAVCSSETLAVAPVAEQNKVLLFSAFSSSPLITDAGDYTFRNGPSDADIAKLDANVLAAKYKKVAMISENTDYSQSVRDIVNKILAEKGVSVVSDENYNSGTKDFRAILTKIKSTNPDVVYINPGTDTKAGGIIVKQARELGILTPLNGNFSLATQDAITAGGKYMNGVVSTDGTDLSQKGKDLILKYKQLYGKDPSVSYEMGASYDRLYIIKQAIESVGTNPTKIKDYLYKMPDYSGTIGTYHFDKNGDVVGVGYISIVLQDGKKIPLNQ